MHQHLAISTFKIFTIVFLCFAAISVSAENTKKIKIFLLGGQSNMVGQGKTAKLAPPYSKSFSKVKIWDSQSNKWEPLSPEIMNRSEKFGPEVSFGQAIAKVLPNDNVRLIKYAANGTALYNDWDPTEGPQYVNFMRTAKTALSNLKSAGLSYEITGMLWLQGESDAHEQQGEAYRKNLSEFITHMRTEFKTSKMPFIIARVRSHYGGKTGQAKLVRDAQVRVAETTENVTWFDTDDCSMINAGHYDGSGLVEIGKRFAEKYNEIISQEKNH